MPVAPELFGEGHSGVTSFGKFFEDLFGFFEVILIDDGKGDISGGLVDRFPGEGIAGKPKHPAPTVERDCLQS